VFIETKLTGIKSILSIGLGPGLGPGEAGSKVVGSKCLLNKNKNSNVMMKGVDSRGELTGRNEAYKLNKLATLMKKSRGLKLKWGKSAGVEDTKLMMKEVDLREELTGRSEAIKSIKLSKLILRS